MAEMVHWYKTGALVQNSCSDPKWLQSKLERDQNAVIQNGYDHLGFKATVLEANPLEPARANCISDLKHNIFRNQKGSSLELEMALNPKHQGQQLRHEATMRTHSSPK